MSKRGTATALLLCGLVLAGCTESRQAAETAAAKVDQASGLVDTAISEAKRELAKSNFKLSGEYGSLPKAEITPEGQLLIDGKTITLSKEQQALMLGYRRELVALAEAGMDIGSQGADLAANAVAESLKGVFSDNEGQVRERIEAEAAKLEAAAMALCSRLPPLLEIQQRVAAAVPEIAPYARISADDVAECRTETEKESREDELGEDIQVEA